MLPSALAAFSAPITVNSAPNFAAWPASTFAIIGDAASDAASKPEAINVFLNNLFRIFMSFAPLT